MILLICLIGLYIYHSYISSKKDEIIFYLLRKCNTTLKHVEYDLSPKGGGL